MPGMSMPAADTDKDPDKDPDRINPGAAVQPGHTFTYTWHVRPQAGPGPHEGSSRVWLYHSHVTGDDIYDGVIGPIIITSAAHARADATPDDVDEEFVNLFMIFNESTPGMSDSEHEGSLKHAINGRIFNTLPGLTMKQGDRVRWYLMDLGSEPDSHSPHWHGNLVTTELGHVTDVVEMMPASMMTVDMKPDAVGSWLFHCHVADHMEAGMTALYNVVPRDNAWPTTFARWWAALLALITLGAVWALARRRNRYAVWWIVLGAAATSLPVLIRQWRSWMTAVVLGSALIIIAVWYRERRQGK
jgi:FtsP/CotA-like multicopper oxidase with cupredoxin domain